MTEYIRNQLKEEAEQSPLTEENAKFWYRHKAFGYKENDVSINRKCRGKAFYVKTTAQNTQK